MRRVIFHSDLNNFYASVECLLRPELRGKPVAVCGDPELRHGIVLAKNMPAKLCGVRTGLAIWEAKRLCPELVVLPADLPTYLRYALMARSIYREYTENVEPFGMDEAWLDVSRAVYERGVTDPAPRAAALADRIRARLYTEIGLTASIGVADNKVFAKLGSDYRKPDATTVFLGNALVRTKRGVVPWRDAVNELPAGELLYVGRATAARLAGYMILSVGDLAAANPLFLRSVFGKNGAMYHDYASGLDTSPVRLYGDEDEVKSIGHSTTTPRDIRGEDDARIVLTMLSEAVASRLRARGFSARTVVLWVRDSKLRSFERQAKLPFYGATSTELRDAALALLRQCFDWREPLRSLGLRATDLVPRREEIQLSFDGPEAAVIRAEKLEETVDGLRNRFGWFAVQRGTMLRDPSLTELNPDSDHVFVPTAFTRECDAPRKEPEVRVGSAV